MVARTFLTISFALCFSLVAQAQSIYNVGTGWYWDSDSYPDRPGHSISYEYSYSNGYTEIAFYPFFLNTAQRRSAPATLFTRYHADGNQELFVYSDARENQPDPADNVRGFWSSIWLLPGGKAQLQQISRSAPGEAHESGSLEIWWEQIMPESPNGGYRLVLKFVSPK
jgi:hypothetical protein